MWQQPSAEWVMSICLSSLATGRLCDSYIYLCFSISDEYRPYWMQAYSNIAPPSNTETKYTNCKVPIGILTRLGDPPPGGRNLETGGIE